MSKLWYKQEASAWEQALPLGNGRLGAMIYGGTRTEHIQINEDSVWFGGPRDRNNPDALENLPEIRRLILNGNISEAQKLMKRALSGIPQSQRPYQTLGEIMLTGLSTGNFSDYLHELDLENAIDTVSYKSEGIRYKRETFINAPSNIFAMKISSDLPSLLNFDLIIKRLRFYDTVEIFSDEGMSNGIIMSGDLGKNAPEFRAAVRCYTKGGTISVTGEHICVSNADEAIIFMTAGTTFDRKNGTIRPLTELYSEIETAFGKSLAKGYDELKNEHIADYRRLYSGVEFQLEGVEEFDSLPTDVRLKEASETTRPDTGLSKLYFDFGRYLLISSSRPGSLPANLQGIWNNEILPRWDSKYTININTQMNYWPAEICGLSECHEPLFDLIRRMLPNGRETAMKMYGCRGFVAHHNTDIWADTAIQDHWIPGSYWVMGAAWLCTHLWTHYEYTNNIEFLTEAFPIMREAALFFIDFLIEDDGFLKTCPSVSPENRFILPNGEVGSNSAGVTMDNQILRDLFTQCIESAKILAIDDDLNRQISDSLSRLMPTRIGRHGQIMEWQEDYEEQDPGHRHISQLYGLHPSSQISPDNTPALANAAKATMNRRLANGGGHTGWSRAWIICNYTKLWDSKNAYRNFELLLAKSTLPNMFDNHPPFQIDGNFGGTEAIALMIVQSSSERIILLPALPAEWPTGHMTGIRLKGNASADIYWKDGVLIKCTIHAGNTSDFENILVYKGKSEAIRIPSGSQKTFLFNIN